MSDSKGESEFQIKAKANKITPARESDVAISEGQAQYIAEIVASPAWSILKKVIVPQRKDHIARRALAESKDHEQIYFFRGQVYELKQFFTLIEGLAKAYKERGDKEDQKFKK